MKKLVFVAVSCLVALSFASCKKDYSCTCTYNGTTLATFTIHDTKSKATDACTAANSTYASYGTGVACSLK